MNNCARTDYAYHISSFRVDTKIDGGIVRSLIWVSVAVWRSPILSSDKKKYCTVPHIKYFGYLHNSYVPIIRKKACSN